MPGTYFCFSDECGDYKPHMTAKQQKRHPFYIRATLIMNSNEWKKFNNDFRDLKKRYDLSLSKELKWANLWTLRIFQKSKKPIPDGYDIKYLEGHSYRDLIDFVEESLALMNDLDEKKIIVSYTKNSHSYAINEKSMLSFHLQEHMQRIEMELSQDEDNLGVLFFDPVSKEKDELFRQIYNDLYEKGDFIKEYSFIKDSLNIENSHHSVGIQIADYISGVFSSVLKATEKNPYARGVRMYFDFVHPNLRRSRGGGIQGYGIREVPSDRITRVWMLRKIKELKAEFVET